MVYCGKLSKGCAPCRAKRTKCDLQRPSCSQCLRTGRICSGYRFVKGWEFLDQTKDVAQKQSALNTKKSSPPFISASAGPSTGKSLIPQASAQKNIIPTDIPAVAEDVAAGCFFNYYVLPNPTKGPSKLYNSLPELYAKARSDSAFSATIVALGIASMSCSMKIPSLMLKANAKYAEALNLINSALRDPFAAKLDETLMVVILLGLYEENNPTTISLDPWTHHVQGALMLLDYRGQQQLQTPHGLDLIRAQRMQVLVNSLVRQTSVPETMLKWSRLARQYETRDEIAESELADLFAQFCDLQACMAFSSEYSDPAKVVAHASSIEAELVNWAAKWQADEPYASIIARELSPDVFSDHWHLYNDIFVADLWNNYRSIRINVNEIIVKQLSLMNGYQPTPLILHYSPDYDNQLDYSKRTVLELSRQICAAVPFYMGRNLYMNETPRESPYSIKNAARAKLILWPLYVAGQSEFISDVMRGWIADQLEKIGETMGLGKAKALSGLVRSKHRTQGKSWRDLIFVNS